MNEKKFHVGIKALVRNENDEILLLEVNPEELRGNTHGIYWDLPGGRIKEGDSVEATLKKELEEELGYTDEISEIQLFHGSISNIEIPVGDEKYGLVLFVFTCKINSHHKIELSFEHANYKWANRDEAKKLLSIKFSRDFTDKI